MIPLKNTEERYGLVASVLHWLIALLMIGLVIVGLRMTGLPDGDPKWAMYGLHKAIGSLTAMLIIIRLVWRFTNPTPRPVPGSAAERFIGHAVHWGLYAVMIIMPVSGYIDSSAGGHALSFFGLFEIPSLIAKNQELAELAGTVHRYSAYVLFGLFALHVAGALKHHFILKDNTLRRILPH